jgi:gliding motility-associated-like protein
MDSTIAIPQQTTVYTVEGMNQWGCYDSAQVTVNVDDNVNEFVPNAFSPNGDGRNDVFKIGNCQFDKLLEFDIYNRWGQLIYHNNSDLNQGWDGTYKGVAQDMGTYNYSIILGTPDGKLKTFRGEVILVR